MNFEQFTTEFRKKFLLYTETWERNGKEVGRKFKIKTNVYPVDIEAVVSDVSLRSEKDKSEQTEKVRRKNSEEQDVTIYENEIRYEICYVKAYSDNISFTYDWCYRSIPIAPYKDENGLLNATKEQLLAAIELNLPSGCISTGMTDDELKSAIADAILVKMREHNEEVAASREREEQERIKAERKEQERREYMEQRTAWIEAHGSDYLKTLLKEGLRVRDVFVKEFEEYESRRIFEQTGLGNTIHTDEEDDSDDEVTITTKRIELSDWTLDEEMLKKYISVKECEGFKDAYIQKIKAQSYYDEVPEIYYKLVAEFETILDDFEIELL